MKNKLLRFFTSLSLILIASTLSAQYQRTIKGTVLERDTHEPVIGASVMIKDTNIGTATDIDGQFSITLTSPTHKTLVISLIGMKKVEFEITSENNITIYMEEENMILEEVVVTGFGASERKAMLSGSMHGVTRSTTTDPEKGKVAGTWKRSGMKDNSIRLEVGDNDFIPLEAAQMTIQIDGFRVRVLLDCFFYNDKGSGLEGMFKLKLPTEATPYYMAFGKTKYINKDEDDKEQSKLIPFASPQLKNFNMNYQSVINKHDAYWRNVKEARIVSKQKAAKAYEQIVGEKVDPALMEWSGADMFTCKVFPLEDRTLHRVAIGYDMNMVEALNFREYILDLPTAEKDLRVDIVAHNTNELTIDISPIMDIKEKSTDRIHYSVLNPKEKTFTIRYNSTEPVLLVQDELRYNSALEEKLDIPYFALNYKVSLPEVPQENIPEDAIFVLDASISSNPDKFNVWLKLIDEVLDKNRDIIKRFAVVSFSIDEKWYTNYYQKNNFYNKERFLEYANTLSLEGATDLALALQKASHPSWLKNGKNRAKHIFLMSDGDCNWGETNMYKFASMLYPGDRVHTYKTGLSGTNTAVLNYISRQTSGYAFTVTGEEEAELTAKSFRYKPWNIVDIKVEDVEDFLISGNPTQLYNGQKLIFAGRQIPEGNIDITVSNGEETKKLSYTVKDKIESTLVSRIYGQIASSYLDNMGFMAEEAAVNYSTYYRVPGAYTSLLMLESDWDYERFGIEDNDAEDYVEDNFVSTLVKNFEERSSTSVASNAKADFIAWIERLDDDGPNVDISDEFRDYLNDIPENNFSVNRENRRFGVYFASEQSNQEKELLEDTDIRFDRLLPMAKSRARSKGKASALRLLSSVVERNPSDIQTIRDVAQTTLDWGMGDHAYYMMKRIIDWRQEDGLAYLTAAEALSKTNNNIDLALIFYYLTITTDWDSSYGNIKDVAAIQFRKYARQLKKLPIDNLSNYAQRFIIYLEEIAEETLESNDFDESDEADILIIVSWNIPDTDIDLHILEPSGETCYYGNKNTSIGGHLSKDVTDGYGPEMYILRDATPGKYKVKLDYYSSSGTQTASRPKSYVTVYRNWGRPNEKVSRKIVQLSRYNDRYDSDDDDEEERDKIVLKFTVK